MPDFMQQDADKQDCEEGGPELHVEFIKNSSQQKRHEPTDPQVHAGPCSGAERPEKWILAIVHATSPSARPQSLQTNLRLAVTESLLRRPDFPHSITPVKSPQFF